MTATVQPGASVADLKNFVNGEYVTAAAGRTSEVVDPSTGEAYALAPVSGPPDVDAALRRAEAAHRQHEAQTGQPDKNWPDWYANYMTAELHGTELPK